MQTVSIHFPKAGSGQIAAAQLLGIAFILLHLVPVFIKVLQCAITGTSGYMCVLKEAGKKLNHLDHGAPNTLSKGFFGTLQVFVYFNFLMTFYCALDTCLPITVKQSKHQYLCHCTAVS